MREFPTGIQKILAAPYQWTGDFPHQAELKPKALQVSIVSQQRSSSAGHQPAAGSISSADRAQQQTRQAAAAQRINQAGLHFLLMSRFILQT